MRIAVITDSHLAPRAGALTEEDLLDLLAEVAGGPS
jgi:3',5'-cyclic AMP phosphodiesterase CpdA